MTSMEPVDICVDSMEPVAVNVQRAFDSTSIKAFFPQCLITYSNNPIVVNTF